MISTHDPMWSPIYTGDPDHDDALEEASDATDARIQQITLDRVAHATDQQRRDAVGTMLGSADPDSLAIAVDELLYGDPDTRDRVICDLQFAVRKQLFSDIEPAVIREVYAEIRSQRAHGQEVQS